jgi:hypothetical protein
MNREIPVTGSLKMIIFLTACVMFLVPAVNAEVIDQSLLKDWKFDGVQVPLSYNVPPLPPSEKIWGNPMGTYKGSCPIGGPAPELLETDLWSKATCRGACGSDCQEDRCKKIGEVRLKVKGGTCVYRNVIECDSHQGCMEHDECYDDCSENPAEAIKSWFGIDYTWKHVHDPCQVRCDFNCFGDYGVATCAKWADIPGKAPGNVGTLLGLIADYLSPPLLGTPIRFSNQPTFEPDEVTPPPDTLLPPEWIQPNITSGPTPPPLPSQLEGRWVGTWKFSGVSTGGCTYSSAGKLEWTISTASNGAFSGTTNVGGIDLRWGISADPQKKCTHYSYTTASGTVTGAYTGNALKGSFTHSVSETGETQKYGWTATLDGDTITGTFPAPKSGGSGGSFSLKRA